MSPDLVRAFAPTGVLRAAINLGNPLLVALNPDNGKPFGLSIDLAHQAIEAAAQAGGTTKQ